MARFAFIFGLAALFASLGAGHCFAAKSARTRQDVHAPGGTIAIDGIAARIEDDIITESQLRELAAFQILVDGRAKSRAELIRELADQWIVRGEASAAKFEQPSNEDVDHAIAELENQFSSPAEFEKRRAAAGISQAAVRRLVAQQLYLSRFLDFRFRPAADVSPEQVRDYYDREFAPQLQARGEKVPPLESVQDTIREVLVQRAIDSRARQWLDETRKGLKIDVIPDGEAP